MGKDKEHKRHKQSGRSRSREHLHYSEGPGHHHPHYAPDYQHKEQQPQNRNKNEKEAGYQLPDFNHPHPLYLQPPPHQQYVNQGYAHDTAALPPPITTQPAAAVASTPQTTIVQPQSTTNNNIMVMPDGKSMPQNIKKWSTGLLGCCNDCGVCFCVLFCLPCVVCKQATRLSENCCVPFLPGGMMALRTKLRTLYGIRGSICCDCCEMTYCTYCAVCQMDRELDRIGL